MADSNVTPISEDFAKEGSEKDRPLRVIDM
jgi:hypothetical protein